MLIHGIQGFNTLVLYGNKNIECHLGASYPMCIVALNSLPCLEVHLTTQ